MEGDGFLRCVDVGVVAQPIEELGAVGLGIDRVHPDVFAEYAPFGAFRLWVDVHPLIGLPHAGQATQRTQIGQRIRRDVGFSEDVVGMFGMGFPMQHGFAESASSPLR